ncbi:hypothetical protein A2U01_0031056, partial [Trifolium medium]|nr:hypothetical protein [Trifolium medium]
MNTVELLKKIDSFRRHKSHWIATKRVAASLLSHRKSWCTVPPPHCNSQ